MGGNQESLELHRRLSKDPGLTKLGYEFDCGPTGGVAIERWGHVRGIWHFTSRTFAWTPSGYNEPTHVAATIEEAFKYTIDVISRN